jgi:hypothetical protein
MAAAREDLPAEIDALRAALFAERARAARVEAELAVAREGVRRCDPHRTPAIADRETDAPALWAALGAHRAAA